MSQVLINSKWAIVCNAKNDVHFLNVIIDWFLAEGGKDRSSFVRRRVGFRLGLGWGYD